MALILKKTYQYQALTEKELLLGAPIPDVLLLNQPIIFLFG